jgi:glycosyltransferase involved in cell wall biosynthesis
MTLAPQQMPALYHSADAFLHMSQAEAFGNVYIEALASGLPVVAHDIARHRWVIGDTGFFVDTDDVEATARHLKSALNSPETERKKRTAFVEKYDWHLIGSQYEAFFNRLLEGPTAT